MTINNLPPIPEGYELVPREEYGTLKAEGTKYFNRFCEDWTPAQEPGLPHLDESHYIRPIKPVATEARSCKTCRHYHDNGSPCLPISACTVAMFSRWEPVSPTPTPQVKPPIGIMPRALWQSSCRSSRIAEIRKAMCRYASEKKDIPYAWVEELFDLEANEFIGKEQP